MNEWEKRPTDFILGIILHLRTVIQINIIYFCLRKRDTGSGPLYPIMGFGQINTILIVISHKEIETMHVQSEHVLQCSTIWRGQATVITA